MCEFVPFVVEEQVVGYIHNEDSVAGKRNEEDIVAGEWKVSWEGQSSRGRMMVGDGKAEGWQGMGDEREKKEEKTG